MIEKLPQIVTAFILVSFLLGAGYMMIDSIGNEGVSTSTYSTTDLFTVIMEAGSSNSTTLTSSGVDSGSEVLLA